MIIIIALCRRRFTKYKSKKNVVFLYFPLLSLSFTSRCFPSSRYLSVLSSLTSSTFFLSGKRKVADKRRKKGEKTGKVAGRRNFSWKLISRSCYLFPPQKSLKNWIKVQIPFKIFAFVSVFSAQGQKVEVNLDFFFIF